MHYNSIIFQAAFKNYFNLSTQRFDDVPGLIDNWGQEVHKQIANKGELFLFTKGCSFGVNTAEFSGAKKKMMKVQ